MKKTLGVFVVGVLIGGIVGVAIGASIDWNKVIPFAACTYGVSSPDFEKLNVTHFGLVDAPEGSRRHFFFRSGFGDVDEYWSFELPPEQAREFIDAYVPRHGLEETAETDDLPSWIINGYREHQDWKPDCWFDDFDQLSEIYSKPGLFCGYLEEKNRICLMNWDE